MPLYPLSDIAVLTFFIAMIIILLIFPNYRIPMISAGIIFIVPSMYNSLYTERNELVLYSL
jgi:L-asparagine transporter-like permease